MKLETFDFNTLPVRVVDREGNPWFVAADVCRVLDLTNPRQAVTVLDDDEKMTVSNSDGHSGTRGGAQAFNLISESGLYALVFKSRKPEAKKFRKWVTAEVLPAIRKTGRYAVPEPLPSAAPALAGAPLLPPEDGKRVSLFGFAREACTGWPLEREMAFGRLARGYCRALGVLPETADEADLGRVLVFPVVALREVHRRFAAGVLLGDADAADFERLLEEIWHRQGPGVYKPQELRALAESSGLFRHLFTDRSPGSQRAAFGWLCERFNNQAFNNGCVLRVRGRKQRYYEIQRGRGAGAGRLVG